MGIGRYCTLLHRLFTKHNGLVYKIKNSFLSNLYAVIKSYLLLRTFIIERMWRNSHTIKRTQFRSSLR